MNVSEQPSGRQMNFAPKVRHDVERHRPMMIAAWTAYGKVHVSLWIGFRHTIFEKIADLLGKIVHFAVVTPLLGSENATPQQRPDAILQSCG